MRAGFDDIVIGAGIVGLAHAFHLSQRGRRVVVLERSPQPLGASARNFGTLWPVGQPPGERLETAKRSVEIWQGILRNSGVWGVNAGSLHLARRDEEMAVLEEFAAGASDLGYDCAVLSPAQTCERAPATNSTGLKGALWSRTEWCVDPRDVMSVLPKFLAQKYGVKFQFSCAAAALAGPIVLAGGREWRADHVWLCTGHDFETLLPELYAGSGLAPCKLQMMRTGSQPVGWRIGPIIAGGLTLRHYRSFERCGSLDSLRALVAAEQSEYDRYGIHVMAAQNGCGEIVIGDSHDYRDALSPFDDTRIDELILDYLSGLFTCPSPAIAARWHGVYCKHPDLPYFIAHPIESATVVTGLGGAGMTLSFGLAEQTAAHVLDGQGQCSN